MIKRFGTEMWRINTQRAFDKDRFRPHLNTEPFQWLCKKRSGLEACNPVINKFRLITKILIAYPPDLSHAIKCRFKEEGDFTELTTIFEELDYIIGPPRECYASRVMNPDVTQATYGYSFKEPIMTTDRKLTACPKVNSVKPTHSWRT